MKDTLLTLKETIAEILVESLKANLILNDPYVVNGRTYAGLQNSNLYDNITYTVEGDDVLVYMPTYAIFVDQGRRPGRFPNIDAIRNWIIKKFSASQLSQILAGPGLNAVTFLIARAISRRGIRPRPFIEQSIEDTIGSKRFDIALEGYIDQELINIFIK